MIQRKIAFLCLLLTCICVSCSEEGDKNQDFLSLPLILSAVALIVSILAVVFIYHQTEYKIAQKVQKWYEKIESHSKSDGTGNKPVSAQVGSKLEQDVANLEGRISALETALNELKELKEQMKAITAMPAPAPASAPVSPAPAPEPVKPKELWVSTFNDRYFMQVSEVKQEQSVFKITSNDGLSGTFELIELYKIKSRNDLQGFVRLTGASLEEAKAFDTTEVGECELGKEGYWKVVEPLTINLQ